MALRFWRPSTCSEQIGIRVLGDRHCSRMLHPSLRRDRVELASAVVHLRDHSQVIMLEGRPLDDGVHDGEASAAGGAHFHQRSILKLPDEARTNSVCIEPRLERRAHSHVRGRQQRGRAIQ